MEGRLHRLPMTGVVIDTADNDAIVVTRGSALMLQKTLLRQPMDMAYQFLKTILEWMDVVVVVAIMVGAIFVLMQSVWQRNFIGGIRKSFRILLDYWF